MRGCYNSKWYNCTDFCWVARRGLFYAYIAYFFDIAVFLFSLGAAAPAGPGPTHAPPQFGARDTKREVTQREQSTKRAHESTLTLLFWIDSRVLKVADRNSMSSDANCIERRGGGACAAERHGGR